MLSRVFTKQSHAALSGALLLLSACSTQWPEPAPTASPEVVNQPEIVEVKVPEAEGPPAPMTDADKQLLKDQFLHGPDAVIAQATLDLQDSINLGVPALEKTTYALCLAFNRKNMHKMSAHTGGVAARTAIEGLKVKVIPPGALSNSCKDPQTKQLKKANKSKKAKRVLRP